jgi:hypothetical protein
VAGLATLTARARPSAVALLIALLSVLPAAAGCGEDAAPEQAGGTPPPDATPTGAAPPGDPGLLDSCDLLTQQEAAAAAGNPVKEGSAFGIICIWEPEDIEDNTNLQLSVAYVPAPPDTDVEAMCQAGLAGIPDSAPLTGTGLGNSAYWDFEDGQLSNTGSLHICFDGGMLDTSAIGLRPEPELQQIAISIAGTALSRV